jgi:hypothetical protein
LASAQHHHLVEDVERGSVDPDEDAAEGTASREREERRSGLLGRLLPASADREAESGDTGGARNSWIRGIAARLDRVAWSTLRIVVAGCECRRRIAPEKHAFLRGTQELAPRLSGILLFLRSPRRLRLQSRVSPAFEASMDALYHA